MSSFPKDWIKYSMNELLDQYVNGFAFNAKKYASDSEYPIIRMSNIGLNGNFQFSEKKSKYCPEDSYEELEKYHVQFGDLIIAMTDVTPSKALIGRAAIVNIDKKFVLNQRVGLLKTKDKLVHKSFLAYWTNSEYFRRYAIDCSGASAQANLGTEDIKKAKVIIPKLSEQKTIAEILTSVDRAIELTEKEIDKLKYLRIAFAENELNPKKWGTLKLSTILSEKKNAMRGGPFGSKFKKEEWANQGTPYLGIDNIHKEYFKKTFKRFVSSEKLPELDSYKTFPYDVIVTVMGTIGRCCIIPDDGNSYISSKHLRTMTIDQSKYNVELLCYQLNYSSWVWRQYADGSQGGAMDAINNDVIKNLDLPDIPTSEQGKVARNLSSIKNEIDMKIITLEKLRNLKNGLMQDLLAGKVRVKV